MAAYLSGIEAAASFIQYPESSIQYLQFGKQIIAVDSKSARTWHAVDLGVVPYPEAWNFQLRLVAARSQGRVKKDVIVFVEHPPVFTLGKRGGRENLLVSEEWLRQSGIHVLQVERGGNITYHGPGQLVVYPIVHLPASGLGVVDMVNRLEEVMIRTCAAWGVRAGRNQLNRGAWVGLKKIGSIGIAVRRGVSFHGLALNVNPDLTPFGWIQPCGLEGVGVTSLQAEAGIPVGMADVKRVMQAHIEKVFQIGLHPVDRQGMGLSADFSSNQVDIFSVGAASCREGVVAGSHPCNGDISSAIERHDAPQSVSDEKAPRDRACPPRSQRCEKVQG